MAEREAIGSRVILRELTGADEGEFLGLARASVGLHHPWYTMPTTPEAYLTRLGRPSIEGRLVCVRDSGAMAGVIIIDSIIRGRFQSASLSYAAFAPAAGRGYMSESLGLVLRFAFGELRLHRLEANIQPANRASLARTSPFPPAEAAADHSTRTAATPMEHRCRYDDSNGPSVRRRGLGPGERKWLNGA